MLSDEQLELLENFSELRSIGQELADGINAWNEANLDEDKSLGLMTQDMSGDAVVVSYTENGFEDSDVVKMLTDIDFKVTDESDDAVDSGIKKPKDVDEHLNGFLIQCIETSRKYPYFVKTIEMQPGDSQHKEEVRIVIPTDTDFRKLSHKDARKIMFMHFLKDIREKAAQFSMLDEALWFCSSKQEFVLILKPLALQNRC